MIGLINCNVGNFRSVANVLDFLNIKYSEVNNEQSLKKLSHIILPGVGSYKNLIFKLKELNMYDELMNQISNKKKNYLGICVGMQILSNFGTEHDMTKGLALIPGFVDKINSNELQLPNIGWHNLKIEKKDSELFRNINENELHFYFVHSYCYKLDSAQFMSSSIMYNEKIVSSIEKENLFGVQFHPEKSQKPGCKLIKNFCSL